jgi:hypothetical protein
MPRLSRKSMKKRKSNRNRKIRKSLKGGNLTPLSTSQINLCPNFDNIQELDLRNIYAKKNGQEQHDCDDLYYRKPDDIFYPINNAGIFASYTAESQNLEDYIPIVESVHGEVSPIPKKKILKPINIKVVKGKKNVIMSRNNSQSLLKQRSCKTINPIKISELKEILLDKQRDLKEDKIELDKDLCHFYYNGSRNKGYLIDGSVTKLRKLKAKPPAKRSPARTPARRSPRRSPARTPARRSPARIPQTIVYNALRPATPSPTSQVNPNTNYYADAKETKRLQREQAEPQPQQPVYTSVDLNTPSSRTFSLNTQTNYADIEA